MLIVTGSLAYDYIMEFPGQFGEHILPKNSHNVNLSFIVNKFAKHRGGTAGNASYTLGLLKTDHLLFAYAGKDFDEYRKDFEKLGIDTTHIVIDTKEYTATGFAMTDTSNNQLWGYYYGASAETSLLQLRSIASEDDFVLIGPQGVEGSISLVKQCIDLKIPYMFDPGYILTDITPENLVIGLSNASIIIGNEYEIKLMEKLAKEFKEIISDKIAITTLGDKGAVISHGKQLYTIEAVTPPALASTTGAGDAWRAGFLSGLQRGYDLEVCGKIGSVAASFAVAQFGTQEHQFTLEEFQNRYKQAFGEQLKL